jgi:SEL1 protein
LYYLRDTAFDKALYYFRLAAENGNSNAMAYLGKLYSEKNDYIKQNNVTALQFFQRSAEKANPMGQAGVGMAFYHGAGVEQSYEKAFKYFQLSADQGYVEGQLMLGVMYYKGQGVKRDYKMAIKWFQAASQSGHALGYYNLGQMHATGTGVLRSCSTATELFKNVAERGKWSSMFIEAYNLYRQGHVEQAFMKYLYLAELGYEVAQSNVAYLLDQMPNQLVNIYSSKDERYRRALTYWNRAAVQGFHTARVKLGDYFY